MPTTEQSTTDFSALYRRLRGGKQSDIRLHNDTIAQLNGELHGSHVLDIGCGRGAMTAKLLAGSPASLLVTDYEQKHVESVLRRLSKQANGTALHGQRLDILSDLSELGERRFKVINLLSVLMHLPPEQSAAAIDRLAQRLDPGGVLLVAVLARAVAEEFYIPAPSKGQDAFYPAMIGLPEAATEADVEADEMDLSILREFYPQDSHYAQACAATGFEVTEVDLIAGPECLEPGNNGNPCPYAPLVARKAPLWKLWKVRRPQ